MPFERLVEKQSKNISKGSAIILITAYIVRIHESFIELLRRRGFHVLTVFLDNASFFQKYEKPDGLLINPTGSMIKVSFGDDIEKVFSFS